MATRKMNEAVRKLRAITTDASEKNKQINIKVNIDYNYLFANMSGLPYINDDGEISFNIQKHVTKT